VCEKWQVAWQGQASPARYQTTHNPKAAGTSRLALANGQQITLTQKLAFHLYVILCHKLEGFIP
jgi:hypothetical protein